MTSCQRRFELPAAGVWFGGYSTGVVVFATVVSTRCWLLPAMPMVMRVGSTF